MRLRLARATSGHGSRLLRWCLYGTGAALAASVALVVLMRFVDPPTTAFVLQRQHEADRGLASAFALRRHWVPLAELPEHVALAALSSEDQRFFAHRGFDVTAMKHALGTHLQGAKLRGASTITQQVAKNLFLWEGRSFVRKALEGYFTVLIELCWPKRRILEVYLNVAELGEGVFGVGAAARHHVGRDARRLTAAQSALLAALQPDPRGRSGREPSAPVRRKPRGILEQMRAVRALRPPQHG